MSDKASSPVSQSTTTTFTLDDIPAAPPVPPEGYGASIIYQVINEGSHHDALEHAAWAAGRLHKADPRADFAFAVREWAENGIVNYTLFAEAECETFDADGEPNGAYSATCWWDRKALNPSWSTWYNTGDLRTPATTRDQIIENGDYGVHWPTEQAAERSHAAALEGN